MPIQDHIRKSIVRISLCIGIISTIGYIAYVIGLVYVRNSTRFDDEPVIHNKNISIETEHENKYELSLHSNLSEHVTQNATNIVYKVSVLYRELQNYHDNAYNVPKNETCIMRPPGSVILGVAKSGTLELVDFLSIHPNLIRRADLELATIDLFNRSISKETQIIANNAIPCTYADQIGIAKTDHFFSDNKIPEKLYNFDKDLKMILIVREPIERMISAISFRLLQKKQHKIQFTYRIKDVPEMDSQFVDEKTGKVKSNTFNLKASTYDLCMERYLKYFSRDQILTLESGEFKSNPVNVLQRVEKFLGLNPFITEDHFVYNKEKQFYCLRATSGMTCYASDRGRAKLKDIKPKTRKKLKEYFKPHNERFFEQIGRRFEWD